MNWAAWLGFGPRDGTMCFITAMIWLPCAASSYYRGNDWRVTVFEVAAMVTNLYGACVGGLGGHAS